MPRILLRHMIPWTLAAVGLSLMTAAASAGFTRGCAVRDLQILMSIEERGGAGTVSAETLGEAILTMMHARIVCHEGRAVDAMAIYDAVAESIAPALSGRARARGMR